MITPDFSPIKQPDKLTSYLKREWAVLLMVALTGTLFNGSMSLIVVLQGRLIDSVIDGALLPAILRQVLVFVGVVAAIQLLRALKRYFVRLFANQTGVLMRRMLYNSLISQDIRAFSGVTAGEMINKAVADVDICVEGMRKVTTEIFDTGVLMLGYLITMLGYDLKTTLAACLFIPLAMYVAEKLKAVVETLTKRSRAQSGAVAQATLCNAENALLYRVNSVEQLRQSEYDKELDKLEKRAFLASVMENSMQPVYKAISLVGIFAVISLGGKNAIDGVWSIGDFTAYTAIFIALSKKASRAAALFNTYQKARVSWERISPSFREYSYPETCFAPDTTASLCCESLGFSYYGSDVKVFKGLSFEAESGELIGVTGKIACGKTALGLALCGLYPYDGSIRLCGKELSSLSQAQRSRAISYMGHDPQLISDTIYENITLGDGGDVSEVLDVVCFSDDLTAMPDGVSTRVGSGGVRLSGGQRDRLALARALYRDSKLMILDDPFSAVDMETERQIIDRLTQARSDKIVVLISHRLSVFPLTDKVIFFGEEGLSCSTHAELLESSAEYRELWASQKGGAK